MPVVIPARLAYFIVYSKFQSCQSEYFSSNVSSQLRLFIVLRLVIELMTNSCVFLWCWSDEVFMLLRKVDCSFPASTVNGMVIKANTVICQQQKKAMLKPLTIVATTQVVLAMWQPATLFSSSQCVFIKNARLNFPFLSIYYIYRFINDRYAFFLSRTARL